jgi:hypothetical protein
VTRRPFLTAAWRNLILANYPVPADRLRPYLPPGVEPDVWDGRHWCSLVAFQFTDTRVLGVSWPGFRRFPEWNLRLYVRHGADRGVVFVREFVPQRLVTWVARLVYNEPYRAARMGESVSVVGDTTRAEYTLHTAGSRNVLSAEGGQPVRPPADSLEHWFKEHRWGFGVTRRGRLLRYEVDHPAWDVFPVSRFRADVDWGKLYGPAWADMTGAEPASVVFAAGSAVSVYPHGRPRCPPVCTEPAAV